MQITPEDQKAVLGLLEAGIGASTSKLSAISRTNWAIKATALKAYATAEDFAELGAPSQYFFGAYCTSPGRVFLSYFSSRSSAMLTEAFLANSKRGLEATPQMQEVAVAEVSNIVINAIASSIADRCGMAFILSSPRACAARAPTSSPPPSGPCSPWARCSAPPSTSPPRTSPPTAPS